MCGIIGVFTNEDKKLWNERKSFFRQALFADTLRGFHSTGLMFLDKTDGALNTFKRAIPAPDVLDMKQFDKFMSNMDDYWMAVGHNRAATKGKINNQNAHPFHCGDIVGVHNGTLVSMHQLDDNRDFDVDSECIFHNIDKNGAKETIEKLNGAFALVWWNVETETMHIIRNKERPLCYAVCEENQSIYFASEPLMLAWICERNSIKIGQIQPFEEMVEYVFTPGDVLNFEKIEREEYQPPKGWSYGHHGTGGTTYSAGRGAGQQAAQLQGPNTVKRGKRKSSTVLEQQGFEVGEVINFFLVDFIPYTYDENSRGQGIGFTSDEAYYPVVVHALDYDDFEKMGNTECSASLVGATMDVDRLVPNSKTMTPNLLTDTRTIRVIDEDPWSEDGFVRRKERDSQQQQQGETIVNFPTARGTKKTG